jgi:hypothetical protein
LRFGEMTMTIFDAGHGAGRSPRTTLARLYSNATHEHADDEPAAHTLLMDWVFHDPIIALTPVETAWPWETGPGGRSSYCITQTSATQNADRQW